MLIALFWLLWLILCLDSNQLGIQYIYLMWDHGFEEVKRNSSKLEINLYSPPQIQDIIIEICGKSYKDILKRLPLPTNGGGQVEKKIMVKIKYKEIGLDICSWIF